MVPPGGLQVRQPALFLALLLEPKSRAVVVQVVLVEVDWDLMAVVVDLLVEVCPVAQACEWIGLLVHWRWRASVVGLGVRCSVLLCC